MLRCCVPVGLTTAMYEYKVGHYVVDYMQIQMNFMAADGWRVVSVLQDAHNAAAAYVTFEREKTGVIRD